PVLSSTRSGGPIAAAWATLRAIGDSGYLSLTSKTLEAVRGLGEAIAAVDGLRLLPGDSTVVAFTASRVGDLDLFVLADELAALGWHTQPQFRQGDLPRSIHLTVTAAVGPGVPAFAAELGTGGNRTRVHGPV